MYNLLIGGAAGQGIDTVADILEKLLKRSGYNVFTARDFMSRIRGGHNFSLIRFGTEKIMAHSNQLDGIVALNQETIDLHLAELKADGFILSDKSFAKGDARGIKIDMDNVAKELGNPRYAGSVAIGALLMLFSEKLELVEGVLRSFLAEKHIAGNLEALKNGYGQVKEKYPHLTGEFADDMLINGNTALALGAIAAGLRFYSAYPMSPSTSIMSYLAAHSELTEIVVEQAEDEIAAINMAIGASFAGARAMTGTSGGGFSLMVEALGLAGIAEIPLVVVDSQRPGPATGLPTRTEQSDLQFVISASQGEFPRMVIALRNHYDAFYQTIRAFNIAEKYQMPVIILTDQYLSDASATVSPFDLQGVEILKVGTTPADAGEEYLRYRFTEDGISPRLLPGKSKNLVAADSDEHNERGWITESAEMRTKMMDKRLKKLQQLKLELSEPEFIGREHFTTLLLGWGSTYGPITEAINILNTKAKDQFAALVFGDIYPLPHKLLEEKAQQATIIINVEQNATGQLALLIRQQSGIVCNESILKYDGRQITAAEIVTAVLEAVQR